MTIDAGSFADAPVLVTGGAGAIGSTLSRALAGMGARVTIIDDLSASQRWTVPDHPNVSFIHGSVLDEQALRHAFASRPRFVYHLAALFANQNSVDHPETDLMVNGMGTLRVLEYSCVSGVERVLYASSGCSIYGANAPLPLVEGFMSDQLATPYQITKLLGELYSNFFHNFHGLSVVRTRFFNSYGPGEVPGAYRNVIPNFIYWAMNRQPLPITGTGEETRDWTFVDDIVSGLLLATTSKEADGEAFNIASGKETRVIDLAEMVNELTENPAGVEMGERRKWDVHSRLLGSVDKARSVLGYSPSTDFRDGLQATVRWFHDNRDLISKTARF